MGPEPPTSLPPPSPALLARVDAMRPVKTRRPRLQAALVAILSLGSLAGLLTAFRPRGDAGSSTVMLVAAVCALAFFAELWWAIVPPRGQVMPARSGMGVRVALAWLAMLAALVAGGHELARDPAFMPRARACLIVGVLTAVVPAALGLVVLRRAVELGGWRLGAIVGGAAGALGALCLQLHCANGHLAHVVVAHGGAALIPVLLLAFVARR
jgi:negative regulator of sigma F NrsF-like protein